MSDFIHNFFLHNLIKFYTDIIDIGMWWALDPNLKIWDFVFWEWDFSLENNESITINIRPNAKDIFK